ncbi:hypothetical protein [Desulfobacter hydrogenophilus]|uniref:hypothetical protein n=1 Tax=Desulfobacter hydrogenophilus TaxID=2291 RepID=UPI0013CF46E0|nr:hypothetical protein [Desulfobacter hydrogenophilus]NDY73971.1 hypothetical protein [Desulfobacter hydrogenophilus]
MKKTLLLITVLFTLAMAGCQGSQRPEGPDHGTLGQEVPAPHGWTDYIQRGGE